MKHNIWFANSPIAHRGFHNLTEVPENSIASFAKAIKNQFPFELDIQATKDGEIVVFHDESTLRLTGKDYIIKKTNLSELKKLKLYGTDQEIPTLKEVLEFVNGQVPILIEIKNKGEIGKLEKQALEILRKYTGEFAVQSFNPQTLRFFLDRESEIYRGLLSGSFKDAKLGETTKFICRNLIPLFICNPHFIAYEYGHLNNFSLNLVRKSKTIPIICWTIHSHDEAKLALKLCDNIIFEGFIP